VIDEQGRPEPPAAGDERATLTGFLDFHRATLQWKCAGLTPAELARRSVPPSGLSLLGLVRHLADVERSWFDRVAGVQREPIFFTTDDPDLDFGGASASSDAVGVAFAAWQTSIGEAREVTDRTQLDDTFEHPRHGSTSLRWVLTHLVEEYARHNGHADLLREAIDGATGE
jgi:uncharacterized damage-inducible protein DinB